MTLMTTAEFNRDFIISKFDYYEKVLYGQEEPNMQTPPTWTAIPAAPAMPAAAAMAVAPARADETSQLFAQANTSLVAKLAILADEAVPMKPTPVAAPVRAAMPAQEAPVRTAVPAREAPVRAAMPKKAQILESLAKLKAPKPTKKKAGVLASISDLIFYVAICVILVTAIFSGGGVGAPKMIMGYSYFTVLTSSMQDEIPKGSFILVHKTDPQDLQIGDNITYLRDQSTSVTHKIIGIQENYQDSGARGFITKGVNNENPDNDIVHAANVVGKVTLSLPGVGAAISYLRANIYLVFIMFGLCVVLSFCIRGMLEEAMRRKKFNTYAKQQQPA